MKALPPIERPDNPSQKIYMREALVHETISFVEVSTDHEEECTTLFLNTVQAHQKFFSDSKDWSAQTRRVALFWYWIHTAKPADQAVSFTYRCPECGEEEKAFFDMKQLAEGFRKIQGKPERSIDFEGALLVVRPLVGTGMENLEKMRIVMNQMDTDGDRQKQRFLIQLQQRLLSFDLAKDKEPDPEKRNDKKMAWINDLTASQLDSLISMIDSAQTEMNHGLEGEIRDGRVLLLSPPLFCKDSEPGGKGEGTRVLFPFRDYIIIQGLHKKELV